MSEDFLPYGLHQIDKEDIEQITKILQGNWITTGPYIEKFEESLTSYTGAKYAVAVNSGTAALDIAVAALDLPKNSEVITTPFTFVATANSILYNRGKVVFVDIDPKTYNIDSKKILDKITAKTKAIIYVDYAGQPCNIDEIKEIAVKYGLKLIEDAAHSLGATYKKQKVGPLADMTMLSFHPVKHITTGEGGAILTNAKESYEKLKKLRNHGIDKDTRTRFGAHAGYMYDMHMLGRNYRITDFQCALGVSQLQKLDKFLKARRKIANEYNEAFKDIEEITTPYTKPDIEHAWHLYTILLHKNLDRNLFFSSLRSQNIGANVHYIPIYKFSYYQRFNIDENMFPVTEEVFSRIISLPMFPKMTQKDVQRVISCVKESLKIAKNNTFLRKITQDDIEKIFQWRNHKQVRQQMFSQQELIWESHIKHWEKRLVQGLCYIIVDRGREVGVTKLDKNNQNFAVDIFLAPEFHGQGIGSKALQLLKEKAKEKHIQKIFASVKEENKASQRIFVKNDFKQVNATDFQCDL